MQLRVAWNINGLNRVLNNYVTVRHNVNGFTIRITKINNATNATSTIISTASSKSDPLHHHGSAINCSGDLVSYSNALTVHIAVDITKQQSNSKQSTLTNVPVVSVTESSSDAITSNSNNRSTLASISQTIIDNTLVLETSSSIEPSTTSSNSGSINENLLFSIFGVIGAIVITCIIAVIVILACIMYRRKSNSVKKKERNTDNYTEVELRNMNNHEVTHKFL
ncbi:PREDICTED: uncharacterized protein LOC109590652 [Amphimedon queenslandica]|uniref:Uncharacterized protein n=1 Tax=Amphimedon queenslandica TaxID=400682 RepID=A0AAN0JYP6_AMPQE|nr:PREDICTED: uncharacterized protein LOC109590652 [Amphimedon queenslandica]|eukprot:XP_019862106.1 PREDICTED: uncharacterized protein LOC109590652 [Amphimedon queenslandica]